MIAEAWCVTIADDRFRSPVLVPQGGLLMAEISGYTGFLQGVADAHRAPIIEADEPPPAHAVLSNLLDAMVAAVQPACRLATFEGEAIFAVAGLAAEDAYDDTRPVPVHVLALT